MCSGSCLRTLFGSMSTLFSLIWGYKSLVILAYKNWVILFVASESVSSIWMSWESSCKEGCLYIGGTWGINTDHWLVLN